MEVALLHYAAPPIIGGVERVLAEHARLMADGGHRVRVIAGRGHQFDERVDFVELPLADSRNVEIMGAKAALDAGTVPETFEPLIDRIQEGLKAALSGAEVLIAHNVCSLNKNLALTVAIRRMAERSSSPRAVLWHHDLAWTTSRYASELHAGYPWNVLRSDLVGAKHVTVSEWRRQELAELLGIEASSIHVIPDGLDPSAMLKTEVQSQQIARRLRLLEADPLVLMPVRITPRKNIELAIRVLGSLVRLLPAARLVVTGPLGAHNPTNREYLHRLLRLRHELQLDDAVHILAESEPDPLPDSVIADFYEISDALILTSTEEGFGIPVLEAGLARIPVFCTDIPSLREVGGRDAHYFDPDADAAMVANSMATVLAANPLHSARKRVLNQYTWQRIYSEHIAPLLDSLKS